MKKFRQWNKNIQIKSQENIQTFCQLYNNGSHWINLKRRKQVVQYDRRGWKWRIKNRPWRTSCGLGLVHIAIQSTCLVNSKNRLILPYHFGHSNRMVCYTIANIWLHLVHKFNTSKVIMITWIKITITGNPFTGHSKSHPGYVIFHKPLPPRLCYLS